MLEADTALGHPVLHGVAPPEVVVRLLVAREALLVPVDFVEEEPVRVVLAAQDIEPHVPGLLARVPSVFERRADEGLVELRPDMNRDANDVHGHPPRRCTILDHPARQRSAANRPLSRRRVLTFRGSLTRTRKCATALQVSRRVRWTRGSARALTPAVLLGKHGARGAMMPSGESGR